MKRLEETEISIKIFFVKIYRDDIENIVNIFKQEESVKSIEMESDNFIFRLDEIEKIKLDKIKKFKIRAFVPNEYCNIEIDLNEYGVSINCDKKTTILFGVAKKIEDYLKKKTRFFSFIPVYVPLKNVYPLVLIAFFLPFLFKNNFEIIVKIMPVVIVAGLYFDFCYKNIIFLKNSNECPNFFIRNKDKIILIIVSSILGGGITFFVQKYLF